MSRRALAQALPSGHAFATSREWGSVRGMIGRHPSVSSDMPVIRGGYDRSVPGGDGRPAATATPRTGVVLAAGRSERLSRATRGRSKALTQVGGVPLVERAVR